MPAQFIKCVECGSDFEFSEGEQKFYIEKGFDNTPKRCKPCREKRKRRNDQQHAVGRRQEARRQ